MKKHEELSREFLLKRGFCCQSGCKNCPYDSDLDPNTPIEISCRTESDQEKYERYEDVEKELFKKEEDL